MQCSIGQVRIAPQRNEKRALQQLAKRHRLLLATSKKCSRDLTDSQDGRCTTADLQPVYRVISLSLSLPSWLSSRRQFPAWEDSPAAHPCTDPAPPVAS